MEEKLIKYLPFTGGLLIFLGVLKVAIYYQYFEIPILSFLTISDVLLLFLNDLNSVLVILIIAVVHALTSKEIVESLSPSIEFDYIILKIRWFLVSFFGLLCIVFIFLLKYEVIHIAIWNIYLVVFLAIQFLTFLFMKKTVNKETFKTEIDFRAHNLLILLIVLSAVSIMPLLAIKDISNIEKNNDKIVLYFDNDEKFMNSNTIYYIGKAGEYHFFFDKIKKTSITFRNSDIKKIEKKALNYCK